MAKAKMTMKKYEGTAADKRQDARDKQREGSKKDNAEDRAAVKRINAKKGK